MKSLSQLRKYVPFSVAILVSLTAFTAQTEAAVIYRQNFGSDSDSYISLNSTSSIAWDILYATGTGDVVNGNALNAASIGVAGQSSAPNNLANVNAPTSLSDSNGFVAIRNGTSSFYSTLVYTDDFSINQN